MDQSHERQGRRDRQHHRSEHLGGAPCYLFDSETRQDVSEISPYLVGGAVQIVPSRTLPLSEVPEMSFGNMPNDGGALLLGPEEARRAVSKEGVDAKFIRRFLGSQDLVQGQERRCIWIPSDSSREAHANEWLAERIRCVRQTRAESPKGTTKDLASAAWRFGEVRQFGSEIVVAIQV